MFLETKHEMSIAETGCFREDKEEPELLPLAEDYNTWEKFQPFSGTMHPEQMVYSMSDEDETNSRGIKRRRTDDERAGKRRRLEPFEPQQQQASLFADPFYVDFYRSIPATVESITRGIAALTISSTPRLPGDEYLASF